MSNISQKVLMEEIVERGLFFVANSSDKKKWILFKDGSRAPMFLDTSKFISYPKLLERVNQYAIQIIQEEKIVFDRILGLPYGGLPFAYGIMNILKVPSLAIRKEGKKNYSTAGDLLGLFDKHDRVLLVEDATVTAKTVASFVKRLRKSSLITNDVITVVDVGADGRKNLQKEEVKLHALFTWKELFEVFRRQNPTHLTKEMNKLLVNIVG